MMGVLRPHAKGLARSIARFVPPARHRVTADAIRSLHTHLAVYNVFVAASMTRRVTLIALANALLVLVAFYINGGCILSDIEQALDPADLFVVDPLLEITGIPRTRAARGYMTMAFMCAHTAVIGMVYAVRFSVLEPF